MLMRRKLAAENSEHIKNLMSLLRLSNLPDEVIGKLGMFQMANEGTKEAEATSTHPNR